MASDAIQRALSALDLHRHHHSDPPNGMVALLFNVLELQLETLDALRQGFSLITRMERRIMVNEQAVRDHITQIGNDLGEAVLGIQRIREQLATGNDTAVQGELDTIDALLSPLAAASRNMAGQFDSDTPAPTPEPTPEPEPSPDQVSRSKNRRE